MQLSPQIPRHTQSLHRARIEPAPPAHCGKSALSEAKHKLTDNRPQTSGPSMKFAFLFPEDTVSGVGWMGGWVGVMKLLPSQSKPGMYARREAAPGASRQSHDASGWGSCKVGALPRWHHERALHLPRVTSPALFTLNPMSGQPTLLPSSGGFPLQKGHAYVHPDLPTGILTQPLWQGGGESFSNGLGGGHQNSNSFAWAPHTAIRIPPVHASPQPPFPFVVSLALGLGPFSFRSALRNAGPEQGSGDFRGLRPHDSP